MSLLKRSAPAVANTGAAQGGPDVVKGIALLIAAVFCFSVLDSISKTMVQSYPLMMVVWVRYSAHVAIMLVLLFPRMGLRLFVTRRPGLQLVRGLALGLSSVAFVAGLSAMPLAETSAIAQIAPVLITLFAVRFLHETAPPGTWIALVISFAGVLLIARPGSAIFSWAAFLPLATAVLTAVYQLLTRRLSNVDNGVSTLFLGGVVSMITLSLIVPFYWTWPANWIDGLMFLSMGAVGAGGHMLLVRAFENAPASTLAPFGYFQVASSLVMGILVFGSFPDEWALAGMLMIVGTGIVMALMRRHQSMQPDTSTAGGAAIAPSEAAVALPAEQVSPALVAGPPSSPAEASTGATPTVPPCAPPTASSDGTASAPPVQTSTGSASPPSAQAPSPAGRPVRPIVPRDEWRD